MRFASLFARLSIAVAASGLIAPLSSFAAPQNPSERRLIAVARALCVNPIINVRHTANGQADTFRAQLMPIVTQFETAADNLLHATDTLLNFPTEYPGLWDRFQSCVATKPGLGAFDRFDPDLDEAAAQFQELKRHEGFPIAEIVTQAVQMCSQSTANRAGGDVTQIRGCLWNQMGVTQLQNAAQQMENAVNTVGPEMAENMDLMFEHLGTGYQNCFNNAFQGMQGLNTQGLTNLMQGSYMQFQQCFVAGTGLGQVQQSQSTLAQIEEAITNGYFTPRKIETHMWHCARVAARDIWSGVNPAAAVIKLSERVRALAATLRAAFDAGFGTVQAMTGTPADAARGDARLNQACTRFLRIIPRGR